MKTIQIQTPLAPLLSEVKRHNEKQHYTILKYYNKK